jgi:hypothetical protein
VTSQFSIFPREKERGQGKNPRNLFEAPPLEVKHIKTEELKEEDVIIA